MAPAIRSWIRLVVPSPLPLAWLACVLTSCGALTSRQISDPAPAVSRLQAGGSIRAEADRLAEPLIESGEIFGLAVGVLTPDGKSRTFGYGRTGLSDESPPPDGDTIFQIGSLSKLFITAVLAVLVEEGVLQYEDTVAGILPPDTPLGRGIGEITLHELATNTSGLPRQPVAFKQVRDFLAYAIDGRNIYAYFDRPYLYRYLRRKQLQPGRKREYVYSNIGFGLLAHLIEVKTGRRFEELLEEKICRPLDLRDTTFVLNEEQQERLAGGHTGDGPRLKRRGSPVEPWDMGEIMGPSGSLYSTTDDLMIFARANLGMLGHPLEPVLRSTQRVQLNRPSEDVAIGWLINTLGDGGDRRRITYKYGLVGGGTGYIGMDPERRIALVVLTNSFSWNDKVGHDLLLRLSLGLAACEAP